MADETIFADDAHGYCANLVRDFDKDRYLATLFAPAEKRAALFALYALNIEVSRIREAATEPNLGEIRLRWWADGIDSVFAGEPFGHPVLSVLADVVASAALPKEPILNLIEARRFDLYNDPMPTMNDLEGYAGETTSVILQLATQILVGEEAVRAANASGHAGVAYAITGLLRGIAIHRARGQVFVPQGLLVEHGVSVSKFLAGERSETMNLVLSLLRQAARAHLEKARAFDGDVSLEALPAFLPVSLCELYLKRMEKPAFDPFKSVCEVPQWRRQLHLLKASWWKEF